MEDAYDAGTKMVGFANYGSDFSLTLKGCIKMHQFLIIWRTECNHWFARADA